MFDTLTQHIKAEEQELKRLTKSSLRIAGVLAVAILVFLILYFFVASLEVPMIPKRVGLSGGRASPVNERAAMLCREILELRDISLRGADHLATTRPA